MTKKIRFQPLEDPPTASSSDDEEVKTEVDEANNVVVISSDSETETTVVAQPSGSRRTKRARVETAMKAKRAKTDGKKPYSQILMEEDEIVILQGVIDFKLDKGKSFFEDEKGFYDFVKRSLNIDLSLYQLTEKVKSLKMKYMGKRNKNVEPTFPDAHYRKCFGLAKVIWGSNGIAFESNKTHKSFLVQAVSRFGVSEDLVRQRWSMMTMETKKRMEEKWRVLQAKEIEILLQKMYFLSEVTSAMADKYQSHR